MAHFVFFVLQLVNSVFINIVLMNWESHVVKRRNESPPLSNLVNKVCIFVAHDQNIVDSALFVV